LGKENDVLTSQSPRSCGSQGPASGHRPKGGRLAAIVTLIVVDDMPTILDKIVAAKRTEIERAKVDVPEAELNARLADAPPVRDFFTPLAAGGPIKLIAEVKRASPSAGVIRADFDPVAIARIYEHHGATCISVLTDEPFFQGRIEYLTQIRAAVGVPLLRKDFILDMYQVIEARAAGADAVLLIAECLDDCNLRKLFNAICALGMTPLVELYQPENLQRVFDAGTTLIGVNNRDLHTFQVDLEHTIRMRARVPDECVLVGESGIKTHDDVRRLQAAGVDAILVGESLMRQPDIGAAVDGLLAR
jgi:indole-3-glycerol phosphate synthase